MEFTQHLDTYEHAKCADLFKWKCLTCSLEAKDQLGFEMHHISDEWSTHMELVVLCGSATINIKVYTIWDVSHQKMKKASSSPVFATLMSAEGRNPVKLVPPRPQRVVKWVTFLLTVMKQKMMQRQIKHRELWDYPSKEGQCW